MLTPDLDQAQRFLRLLSNDRHTFQILPESKEAKSDAAKRPFVVHAPNTSYLGSLNQKGNGIFVMVNEGNGQGRKNENVRRVRGHFVDFDKNDPPANWLLEPSIIVQTSPSRHHAYWLLDEAIVIENHIFNSIQEQLSISVGAQPTDTRDLCRVMRVPGFYHQKGDPTLSVMLQPRQKNDVIRYSMEKIYQSFGIDSDQPKKAHKYGKKIGEARIDDRSTDALENAIRSIEQSTEGQRRNELNRQAFKVGGLIREGLFEYTNSEDSLIKAGISTGLQYDEATKTVREGLNDGIAKYVFTDRKAAIEGSKEHDKDQKDSHSKKLLECLESLNIEYWRDENCSYFSIRIDGNLRHFRTDSTEARSFSKYLYRKQTSNVISTQAVSETLSLMDAMAQYSGNTHQSALRVRHISGKSYINLGGEVSKILEVSDAGWSSIGSDICPVRFLPPEDLKPLPEPIVDRGFDDLRLLLNVDKKGFILCTAWLLSAMSGIPPFPPIVLSGEQDSGKSTVAAVLKNLVDPTESERRRPPKNEHDLFIAAQNAYVLSFENVSSVPDWFSD